jgi:hypothetical protein
LCPKKSGGKRDVAKKRHAIPAWKLLPDRKPEAREWPGLQIRKINRIEKDRVVLHPEWLA